MELWFMRKGSRGQGRLFYRFPDFWMVRSHSPAIGSVSSHVLRHIISFNMKHFIQTALGNECGKKMPFKDS
jgi:hypothetical protein